MYVLGFPPEILNTISTIRTRGTLGLGLRMQRVLLLRRSQLSEVYLWALCVVYESRDGAVRIQIVTQIVRRMDRH